MLETLASWHHFIVHFAVAFTIGSAGFDIIDFFFPRRRFEESGFLLMLTAIPFLLLAVLTGNLAETHAPGLEQAALALENHIRYANIAVWLFCGVGLWRIFLHFKHRYHGRNKVLYMFIVATAAASVYLAALHGGSIRHAFPEAGEATSMTATGVSFPLAFFPVTEHTVPFVKSPDCRSTRIPFSGQPPRSLPTIIRKSIDHAYNPSIFLSDSAASLFRFRAGLGMAQSAATRPAHQRYSHARPHTGCRRLQQWLLSIYG